MKRKGFLVTIMGLAASPFLPFRLFLEKEPVRSERKVWFMDTGDFIDGPRHCFKELYF